MEDRVGAVLQYVDSLLGLDQIGFMEKLLSMKCMQVRDDGKVLLDIERERFDERLSEMDESEIIDCFMETVGDGRPLEAILSIRNRDDVDQDYYTRRHEQAEKRADELLQEYESRHKETNKQSTQIAYEHKEGQGSLFRNEKQNDRQPDLKGTILIGGVTYRVVGWERTSQNGTSFISLQAEPLQSGQS